MKRLLVFFVLFVQASKTEAQVVFCPPGAEWNYLFLNNLPWYEFSEKITYTGDTLVNGETVKRIVHRHFFPELNVNIGNYQTFIKQNGDTVFMKNGWTSNQWQILYNFGATVGSSWTNIFIEGTDSIYTSVTVDSTKYVTINNMSLKRLYVTYACYYAERLTTIPSTEITERFGCSKFMFNYCHPPRTSDGDYFLDFLCYKDNGFGQVQFTSKPCNYSNPTSVGKEIFSRSRFGIYPNPSSGNITIEFFDSKPVELIITNALGQLVYSRNELFNEQELDLSFLAHGLYYIHLKNQTEERIEKLIVK